MHDVVGCTMSWYIEEEKEREKGGLRANMCGGRAGPVPRESLEKE